MCHAEDFWLGLKKIYSVVKQGPRVLHVDLEDWKDGKHWAEYRFTLEGPSTHYTIHLSHLAGDLADALANITGNSFSTKDKMNDNPRNCPRNYTGKKSHTELTTITIFNEKFVTNVFCHKVVGGLMPAKKPTLTAGTSGWGQRDALWEGKASTGSQALVPRFHSRQQRSVSDQLLLLRLLTDPCT